jgi:Tn3 transposase DDE domain-containing protein
VRPAGVELGRIPRQPGECRLHSFIHRLGEIRDRTYENQRHRASGLLVTAIILCNTRYLERAVATLRQTENVSDRLLEHLSPLGLEHINPIGDYIWIALQDASENHDGLKPLRTPHAAFSKAVMFAFCLLMRTETVQNVGGQAALRNGRRAQRSATA